MPNSSGKQRSSAINWSAVRKSLATYLRQFSQLNTSFGVAKRLYASTLRASLSHVTNWVWYSDEHFKLEPMFFELGNLRPGRKLKGIPKSRARAVKYGLDDSGRVHVMEDASFTEFRDYKEDRI